MYHGPDAGCSSNAIKIVRMRIGSNQGDNKQNQKQSCPGNCKQEEKETAACDPKIIKDKTLIVAKNENGVEAVYKNGS